MHRSVPIIAAALLAFAFIGCATPAYVKNLDGILEQETMLDPTGYGYRCTAGAHRGASVTHGENTLAALKAADEDDKYAFIEFDVQYSKDRRIVVFHDKRILRLYGNMRSIGKTDFARLSELTHNEIVAYDEVIPILHKKLNIEIKSRGDIEEDKQLVDEIMADLVQRGREDDVLISSISADVLTYVKQQYPQMPCGQIFWLTTSTYLHFEGLTKKLYEDISTTRADYLMLHVANLRNIKDLLALKPKAKTIVFWDFDDTIFVVHKDFSDRLWGNSGIGEFFRSLHYKLLHLF